MFGAWRISDCLLMQVIADVESRWQIEGGIDQPLVDKAPGTSNNNHVNPVRMHSFDSRRVRVPGVDGYAISAPSDGCNTYVQYFYVSQFSSSIDNFACASWPSFSI